MFYLPEPLPQPVLVVTEVGSTYIEVAWVLPEESKSNAAHIRMFIPLFPFNVILFID